jgi:ATP phosphoribosyltransferase regulatory subunit HisZ
MSGLFGAATARAEAQVVRLAMLYALLDEKAQIDMPHLLAALALWEYAEASARHVFGSSLGDPIADEILRAVRAAGQDGMTRTQIRDLFKRNCSAERIGAALDLLARRNHR